MSSILAQCMRQTIGYFGISLWWPFLEVVLFFCFILKCINQHVHPIIIRERCILLLDTVINLKNECPIYIPHFVSWVTNRTIQVWTWGACLMHSGITYWKKKPQITNSRWAEPINSWYTLLLAFCSLSWLNLEEVVCQVLILILTVVKWQDKKFDKQFISIDKTL